MTQPNGILMNIRKRSLYRVQTRSPKKDHLNNDKDQEPVEATLFIECFSLAPSE